jgi:hypothetical protein
LTAFLAIPTRRVALAALVFAAFIAADASPFELLT